MNSLKLELGLFLFLIAITISHGCDYICPHIWIALLHHQTRFNLTIWGLNVESCLLLRRLGWTSIFQRKHEARWILVKSHVTLVAIYHLNVRVFRRPRIRVFLLAEGLSQTQPLLRLTLQSETLPAEFDLEDLVCVFVSFLVGVHHVFIGLVDCAEHLEGPAVVRSGGLHGFLLQYGEGILHIVFVLDD